MHRQQNDLAAAIKSDKGDIKAFDQWREDVQPMLNHQVGSWLHTEFNTAVLRAHQADDWQRFERDADLFPNLEWMESTSSNPDEVHRGFWGIILPVDDAAWDENRPGDRWNCKCSLHNTDAPANTKSKGAKKVKADPGLESNPGKDAKIFSDTNPYQRNAYPGAEKAVEDKIKEITPGGQFKLVKEWINGGRLYIHPDVDNSKSDYKDLLTIGRQFAQNGEVVKLLPSVHFKSEAYQSIFGKLKGTPYERKCPDLLIGGVFYEYESFVKPWKKSKIAHMFKHGYCQSERVIINNNKGCSHRYLKKRIVDCVKNGKSIKELWVYEKGKATLIK